MRAGLMTKGRLALGGCANMQPVPPPRRTLGARTPGGEPVADGVTAVQSLFPDPVDPMKRTWAKGKSNTAVTWITDDTARIEARGGPLTGIETPNTSGSLRLLSRTAAEGAARGRARFKITHLRDRSYSSAGNLFGGMAFEAGRTPHIGADEDLTASRYERAKTRSNRAAAPRAWGSPGLTAVVVFTDDAPTRRRPLFEVEAVYRNLVVDGVME
ncbi:MAG: hypothetical protein RKE49_06570 [Oceanicaulis sp.]